jgi:hypothetical protein
MIVRAIKTKDDDLVHRMWYLGDADHQRAVAEAKDDEKVYAVELHDGSGRVQWGWAVGK